jgi:TetR/AcrR family transcriptional regulator
MPGSDQKPSGNVDVAVRQRLLDAAVEAFARFGFEGASLRMIAQNAGVAFQLITYYFGSKEDLWFASVDFLFEERVNAAKTTFSPVKDFEAQLREWLRIALRFSIQEPQLRQIVCQEYLARSDRYDKYLRPRLREATPYFNYFFNQAQAQGIATRLSTSEMMLILRGILLMAALAPEDITSLVGGKIDSQRTIDVLTDFIVNLFMKGEGTSALRQPTVVPTA